MFKKILTVVIIVIFLLTLILLNVEFVKAETEVQNPPLTIITFEDCIMLQKIAVAEAHDTNPDTMAQVMLCVMNRVLSDKFPNTVEEVIKQKGQFSTYPELYEKYEPNEMSLEALCLVGVVENKGQLYFENTKSGSWISTHKQFVFSIKDLCFYK